MKVKMFLKQNEDTIKNGTAGCKVALVEREYEKDGVVMVSVLVRDYDNFPCGPYQLPKEYLEVREIAG